MEVRSRQGLFAGLLFTLVTSAALGYGSLVEPPSPGVAAGMIAAGLLFAAAVTVPRTFLAEDEQGTMDLLRLTSDPSAAYAGKLAFSALQNVVCSLAMAAILSAMMGLTVEEPLFYWGGMMGAALSLASGMSFTASLVLGAANRWLLAAALGVPLLLPQMILAVLCLRFGLGDGGGRDAESSLVGLYGYAVSLAGLGPALAPWFWGLSRKTA